jgi:hypothetical protein
VALLAVLTYGLTPGEHWVATAFLVAALALLCWSFGSSVVWQLRQLFGKDHCDAGRGRRRP